MTSQYQRIAEAGTGLIVRATLLVGALTALGSVFGLVRDLLLARLFGATGRTDAFLVAWTVPETASPLLIEGAMAFLMVPLFVRALADSAGLAAMVRATLPRIVALLAVAAVAVIVTAPALVHLLAPGLAEPALAVRCTRVTALTVLTFGVAGYMSAALRACHVFGWPGSIYVAYNIGILAAIAVLHARLGVFSAALGVAVGGALMVAVQGPSFWRRLEPGAFRRLAAGPQVALVAFIPIATFGLIRQAQVYVERFLGSRLAAGTISELNYAQKVAQVPMVLSVMVALVTFPMLAQRVATGDVAGSRHRLEWDLRVVSATVLAASAYVVAFASPVIRVLFQHGAFTADDAAATAAIMRVYSFGLLGQAAVVVLSRSYFSDGRPIWYPALVMAAGLAATVVVSAALLPLWGGPAIAAGNAAGITLTAGLMLAGLRTRVVGVSLRAIGGAVARLAIVAAAAGLAGWLACGFMSGLPAVATAIIGVPVVAGVFLLVSALTGAEETRQLTVLIRKVRHVG